MPQTRSSVELADANGRTRLTLRARYPSPADLQRVLDIGVVNGTTDSMGRLDAHLAGMGKSNG